MPLVVFGTQVDLIDLYDVPGVLESSANIWVKTCYNAPPGSWASEVWLKKARIPKAPIDQLTDQQVKEVLTQTQRYR